MEALFKGVSLACIVDGHHEGSLTIPRVALCLEPSEEPEIRDLNHDPTD